MLVLCYQDSIGVIRNMNQTRTYFEKAARDDNAYALYYLVMLNLDQQHDLSLKYLERVAHQYHSPSIAKLSQQYFVGWYYPANSQKILDCCLKSHVKPDFKFMTSMLSTGNVTWDSKYHKYWSATCDENLDDKVDNNLGLDTHRLCRFDSQVKLLLLISKHR